MQTAIAIANLTEDEVTNLKTLLMAGMRANLVNGWHVHDLGVADDPSSARSITIDWEV